MSKEKIKDICHKIQKEINSVIDEKGLIDSTKKIARAAMTEDHLFQTFENYLMDNHVRVQTEDLCAGRLRLLWHESVDSFAYQAMEPLVQCNVYLYPNEARMKAESFASRLKTIHLDTIHEIASDIIDLHFENLNVGNLLKLKDNLKDVSLEIIEYKKETGERS